MSISKRTVFYDQVNGCIRPLDWALVVTGIGTMIEPFQWFKRTGTGSPVAATEFDDECTMINEFQMMDSLKEKQILGNTVHGGFTFPRVGR